eukprot:6170267-Prymnesium_polylepis.1
MPPLIPGPSGFTTVGTVAQLRAAIDVASSGSALALFVPPGQVLYLEGSAIVVGLIELQIYSSGEGAVIDAQHQSRVLELRGGASVSLHLLTLAHGQSSTNGGA